MEIIYCKNVKGDDEVFIEKFEIKGLFGNMNVALKLNKGENIYIGENGIGKTTILNTLYYTLKMKFNELASIDFSKISIKFSNFDEIEVSKEGVEFYSEITRSGSSPRYLKNIEILEKLNLNLELIKLLDEKPIEEIVKSREFTHYVEVICRHVRYSPSLVAKDLNEYLLRLGHMESSLNELIKGIQVFNSKNEVLYFPTFRRIEEDINKLLAFSTDPDFEYLNSRYDSKTNQSTGELIRFGMEDVKNKIDILLDLISKTSINSFNQMTAILLEQYVDNDLNDHSKYEENLLDVGRLVISLNRIGNTIAAKYKTKIIELVKSKEIFNEENKYLLNFILNLLKSHEQLKHIDEKLENFAKVCNGYLVNKKFKYDPSNVELPVINQSTKREILLKNLSSGEKQIISTFSKIYLEHNRNYFILFDEPELSLSIEWQEKYIPDIMASKNCNQLICVTHSPFIFNDLTLFEISKEILNEITFEESECELKDVNYQE